MTKKWLQIILGRWVRLMQLELAMVAHGPMEGLSAADAWDAC